MPSRTRPPTPESILRINSRRVTKMKYTFVQSYYKQKRKKDQERNNDTFMRAVVIVVSLVAGLYFGASIL